MQKTKRFIVLLLCALLSAPATLAQYPQRDGQTDKTASQDVLIIIQQQQVRFTSQKAVQEMQLQIFNQAGEMVYDSGLSYGPEINWPLQSADGQPLKSGLYAYTLSIKEQGAETARIRRGHFIVDRAGDREKTGDRLWITSQNENGVGVEMTVARGEENTVAGVEAPAERTVNSGGVKRDDSGRSVEGETESGKQTQEAALTAAVNGTPGQLARFFSPNQIGDSGVTVDPNGRVGVGTSTPQSRLDVVGNWTGEQGALQLIGDKPTLRFTGGAVSGNHSWILHQGSDGPGNLQFFRRAGAGTWNHVMTLAPSGKVGIGTTNPAFKLEVNDSGTSIVGRSTGNGVGVYGESRNFNGVRGVAYDANHGAVVGVHESGGFGIYGQSSGPGVVGKSLNGGPGVYGESAEFNGVRGVAHNANHGAVVGVHMNGGAAVFGTSSAIGVQGESTSAGGYGGYFRNTAGGVALRVEGTAQAGVLQITGGADFAENFDVNIEAAGGEAMAAKVEPGMVVSIDPNSPGKLTPSTQAYDRRVAGIISGAGGVKPGMIMSQEGTLADGKHPVALSGRVYCMVDASNGAIEPGDLLTTSGTPGHAMKVTDGAKAQGAIIGKAMTGLKEGKGLVLVLVTLQ